MLSVNRHKKEILRRIKQDPYYHEVVEIADRNTSGKFYLVGGKLYRTAIELIHDCYVGADKADWDFLCLKVESHGFPPRGWRFRPIKPLQESGGYPGEYSSSSKRLEKVSKANMLAKVVAFGTRNALKVDCKIDLIDVADSTSMGGFTQCIKGYHDAVPMSIQAIAYDFQNDQIIGDRGIWSIIHSKCFLNPTFDLRGARYRSPSQWQEYFQVRTKGLGFEWHNGKHLCYCSPEWAAGLWAGCKCGGV